MKDNFSKESDKYVRYRPTYPAELYQYINTITPGKASAWDCGTGNGQVALELAKSFDQVQATDISQAQLDHAPYADNIKYSVQSAEDTHFSDASFDLVTVAQAIHWFDFDLFYKEVSRTAKKGAVICVIGYARLEITPEIDEVITRFYTDIIGPYWDPERRYVDDGYQTIPFPYEEIETPTYARIQQWTLDHLIGYLKTWSAVKHYIAEHGHNPVDEITPHLAAQWKGEEVREVKFPILLRAGQL